MRNTLSHLDAEFSQLSSVVDVLSSNPSLADTDGRSEEDSAIVLFKAALHKLPQADSFLSAMETVVGFKSGASMSWTQRSAKS